MRERIHLPRIASGEAFRRFRHDVESWRAPLVELLRPHGLSHAPLAGLGGGTLVVGVGSEHVLKLAPPIFGRQITADAAALAYVEGKLPIATPRVIASGVHDEWPWFLMTRVSGTTARARWNDLDLEEKIDVARAIGTTLAALHALASPKTHPLDDAWLDFVAEQRAACVDRQSRWGVPRAIVADISAWIARDASAFEARVALLHADLTDENVLLEEHQGRWRVSAAIDFGDARVGDPTFDLVTPALLVARGDHVLFRALLDGYGVSAEARDASLVHRLTTYAALHPFNDLTRYLGFSPYAARSLDTLARAMFPIDERSSAPDA